MTTPEPQPGFSAVPADKALFEGLDEAVFTCRLAPEAINLAELREAFSKVAWFAVRADGTIKGYALNDEARMNCIDDVVEITQSYVPRAEL